MNKKDNITEEQKRELISLRLDKKYSIDKLMRHAQTMGIEIRDYRTMKKRLDEWQEEIGAEIKDRIEEEKLSTEMDMLSRIRDWSALRLVVKARLIDKLKSGDDIRFGELANMLLQADDKLASLLGVKEQEVVKHELTVDFAGLFQRIKEVKRIEGNVEDAEYESAIAEPTS